MTDKSKITSKIKEILDKQTRSKCGCRHTLSDHEIEKVVSDVYDLLVNEHVVDAVEEGECCNNQKRGMDGWCNNCGDPCY